MRDVRDAMQRGDLAAARAKLADSGRGTDDLLFALEDGLLLFYAGDHSLSNLRFEFVERRIDDLYTKSITRAALSMLTSDLVLRFEPRGIENFLVNYYRGLNYAHLAEPAESWVEWRHLASKLQFSREHGDEPYLNPPFFSYLVGLGLEADDPNDAYIAFRNAEAAYRAGGGRAPPDLVADLTRLAAQLGFAEHLDMYERRYGYRGADPGGAGSEVSSAEFGEVVVLVEDGLVAPIEEVQAYIPILEERAVRFHKRREDERFRSRMARTLAREYAAGDYSHVRSSKVRDAGIAYVLPLAFPAYGRGEPAFSHLEVKVGGISAAAQVGLEISDLQGLSFEDRLLGIYVKTIARALLKYAAAEKLEEAAKKEGGETAGDVVGIVSNIVNVVTERADTRAWLGLPHRIWLARLRVPPGPQGVELLLDGQEVVILDTVDVTAGERSFVTARVF